MGQMSHSNAWSAVVYPVCFLVQLDEYTVAFMEPLGVQSHPKKVPTELNSIDIFSQLYTSIKITSSFKKNKINRR